MKRIVMMAIVSVAMAAPIFERTAEASSAITRYRHTRRGSSIRSRVINTPHRTARPQRYQEQRCRNCV